MPPFFETNEAIYEKRTRKRLFQKRKNGFAYRSNQREQIQLVIVTNIWQKLSSFEREMTLIVRNFWQLFSRMIGETFYLVY
jgi:hypothetical protein